MSKNGRVTLQTIANKLDVSVATVSKVVNGVAKQYRISNDTIDAVNNMILKLNYAPNSIAKSLRTKKTFTLGLIVPDISNPWFANIALEIENESRSRGYNILLCNSNDNLQTEKDSLNLLQNRMVDGIIIVPIGIEYQHLLTAYKSGLPVVLVDRFFKGIDLPYISCDDYTGAFEATKYLIDCGHKKVACIQGLAGTSSNIQRVDGYKKALQLNKIKMDKTLLQGFDYTFNNGYLQAKKILNTWPASKVTAIFSTGNQITLGILKAFKEKGIRVPDDISIVSFDEWNYSELLYTPLSTVSHMGDSQAGAIAVNILFGQFTNQTVKANLLATKLIKRESVKKVVAI